MLIINCTKAAAEFFSTTKKGKKISPIEPAPEQTIAESNDPQQWQWLVHAIKVKGLNVLVAMEYQTRFCITLSALKKGDVEDFLDNLELHLTVHAHEMLVATGADEQTIEASLDRYRETHNHCAFYQRSDRSAQANINDVTWHFRCHSDEMGEVPTEFDLIGFDLYTNQLPRKRKDEKDFFIPQKRFLSAWLMRFGEPELKGDFAAPDNNVITLDDYRKK